MKALGGLRLRRGQRGQVCAGASQLLCLSLFPSATPCVGVGGSAPSWLLPGTQYLDHGHLAGHLQGLALSPGKCTCPHSGQPSPVPQRHPPLSPRQPPSTALTPKPPCAGPWGPWLLGERHELPRPPYSILSRLHAGCSPWAQPAWTCAGLTAVWSPAWLSLRPARPAQSPSEHPVQ